jgi:intracellular septation protein A
MWGYLWSLLYFAMAAGNLYVSQFYDLQTWVKFNAIVPTVGPIALFLIQYMTMRVVIHRTVRAKVAAGLMAVPPEYAK